LAQAILGSSSQLMGYLGSPPHLVEMLTNYIRGKVSSESAIDNSDTRIDRQRRIIGLILFVIFILLPALFIIPADRFF
jgi:hypothetical protein